MKSKEYGMHHTVTVGKDGLVGKEYRMHHTITVGKDGLVGKEYRMHHTITVGKDGLVGLEEIIKGTNVKPSDVHYYEMDNGGAGIIVRLFDKNKKQIHIKERTCKDLAKDVKAIMDRCSKAWFPQDLIELINKELEDE